MIKRFSIFFVFAALAVGPLVAVSGCGAGPGDKPQSIASDERVNEIVEMRKIFDKAGGKWEALSEEEKAEYTRLAGDAQKADLMWKNMVSGPGVQPGQ